LICFNYIGLILPKEVSKTLTGRVDCCFQILVLENFKVIGDANQVKKSIGNKNVKIVDARSKEEYSGTEVRAARRGHIPSAINIDWTRNIEDNVFKSRQKLSKIYSRIPKDAQIITYCQGGYRAANTFLVLKMLGYKNVKMYLGSWGEWGNKEEFPAEQ